MLQLCIYPYVIMLTATQLSVVWLDTVPPFQLLTFIWPKPRKFYYEISYEKVKFKIKT
jgi:hypothetical protein